MQEISNIVRYYFSVEFNTESVYYYRFITHLKFFAQRLLTDKEYEDDQDNELFNTIRQKYRTSYKCVEKIAESVSYTHLWCVSYCRGGRYRLQI